MKYTPAGPLGTCEIVPSPLRIRPSERHYHSGPFSSPLHAAQDPAYSQFQEQKCADFLPGVHSLASLKLSPDEAFPALRQLLSLGGQSTQYGACAAA